MNKAREGEGRSTSTTITLLRMWLRMWLVVVTIVLFIPRGTTAFSAFIPTGVTPTFTSCRSNCNSRHRHDNHLAPAADLSYHNTVATPTTTALALSAAAAFIATTNNNSTNTHAHHHQHHHTHHRNIVVLSHNVSDDFIRGLFDIDDLLQGRVDVLARCANAALWVSNGIRKDTNIFLMLFPHNVTIEIQGAHVKGLNPNERTMALYLQRTLLLFNNANRTASDNANGNSTAISHDKQVERLQQRIRYQEGGSERPVVMVYNPHKPGALPKSEKKRLRDARKKREAMVRRIKNAAAATSTADGSGDSTPQPPPGFIVHQHDTLQARLDQFSPASSTGTGNRGGGGPILMLNEVGAPLGETLQLLREIYDNSNSVVGDDDNDTTGIKEEEESSTTGTETTSTKTTTTLILGNQLGYTAGDEKLLMEHGTVRQVSLGPLSLLTSQCITITHHYLDCHC
jgi:tRNA pseudouridine-54 N-methylase